MITINNLKSRIALITGSTSGIGKGIAEKLAASGCHIALNGFGNKEEIQSFQAFLEKQYHIQTHYAEADLSKPIQIKSMINTIEEKLGLIDILVNNAGIQHVDTIADFPDETWDAILAINLSSAFHTIKHTITSMQQRGYGRIINIASAHGLVASAKKAAYVTAKHGIIGLTKVVALENAERKVTCNAICPGWVLTPLVQKQIDAIASNQKISNKEATLQLLGEKQPTKQFTTVEQIAAMVCFLCSDDAINITGSSYAMDGGWTAQ